MFSYSSLVSIIQTILVLILVIILANLSLKLLNRKMSQNSRMIRIVERINVSNNSALAIAEICGKYYLMSFTDKANTILRELDKDEVENYLDDYEGHNSFSDMKDKAHLFWGMRKKD
ncbi:MAG: flagellar biosynthetic protein FliO [Tissierellia bacterium]|jgi:flagellar biogenesis protein FliO|nr:flagellar biosynthetic protein FliO [Tissierellia bacterium]